MHELRLREGVSFCRVDGRHVFLDVERDRYFMLEGDAAAAFEKLVSGSNSSPGAADRERLLSTGLVEPSKTRRALRPVSIRSPQRSLFDELAEARRPKAFALLEIALLLAGPQRARRRTPLSAMLLRIQLLKRQAGAADIVPAARLFNALRPWAPVRPHCLSDSLALATYLLRRGGRADIVFGVKLAPFAAHAWVQTHDLLLNDHVDRIREYAPVLVV
jgi:hypothetical protein